MKKGFMALGMVCLLFACSKNNETEVTAPDNTDRSLKSKTDINQFIRSVYNQQGRFEWNAAPDNIIWSAGEQSDHIFAVGFRLPGGPVDMKDQIAQVDINNADWKLAKTQVLQLIYQSEKRSQPQLKPEQVEAFTEDILPVVDVTIRDLRTIELLRKSNLVRYVEPMGYEPEAGAVIVNSSLSSSGCDSNTPDFGLAAGSDFANIAPNAKQSWNHGFHGVNAAWTRTTGSGVKVFIVDSGISPDQDNFGSQFNQGSSSGRTIEKIVTLPRNTFLGIPIGPVETPNDGCGHGTAMAGACAAPRGSDGNAAGIAYNCNLVTCRAATDVFLDESRESKGVADAYTNAANRADVKVISMSMGRITSSGQITDAINYAYGKGKLMFCAAGTSFGWTSGWFGVIFPAWLGNVNAVTGIKDNPSTQCDACHDGSAVDFTIVMEKASNGRHPLTTAMNNNQPATVGGSSVATAQCAGIAALVYARNPGATRDQVLNRLITTASNYPNRNGSFGWGRVNADAATQ
jgi:subtilisin family serine protease